MANPWDADPIDKPAASVREPWKDDPIVKAEPSKAVAKADEGLSDAPELQPSRFANWIKRNVEDPIMQPPAPSKPEPDRPRWDMVADTKRYALEQYEAMKANASGANPSREVLAKEAEGGIPGRVAGEVSRLGNAAMVPFNALGMAASPLLGGVVRGLFGSAASYLPWETKETADNAVDTAMMGFRPGGINLSKPGMLAGGGAPALPPPAVGAPESAATFRSPNALAQREIARRLSQDIRGGGATPEGMLAEAQGLPNKPLTMADLGDENVRGLLGNAARKPGEARTFTKKTLDERDAAAGDRLVADVREAFGGETSAYRAVKDLTTAQARAAAPLKEEAFAANQSVASKTIDAILDSPDGKGALRDAARIMQNDGTRMGRPDPELLAQAKEAIARGDMQASDIPKGGVASGLKLQTLDYVKQALWDRREAALRTGDKNLASSIDNLRVTLTKEMDALDVTARTGPNSRRADGGAYERYRRAYSGPAESKEAIEWGREVLKKNPEQIADEFPAFSPADQEYARLGVQDRLTEALAKKGAAADEAKVIIGNRWTQNQLRPLFDDERSFTAFIDNVKAEAKMFELRYDIGGNSKSAGRLAEDHAGLAEAGFHALHAGAQIAHGRPFGAVRSLVGARNALKDWRRSPEVNAQIVQLLLEPLAGMEGAKPPASARLLRDFSNFKAAKEAEQAQSNFLRKLSRPGPFLAGPEGQQRPPGQ